MYEFDPTYSTVRQKSSNRKGLVIFIICIAVGLLIVNNINIFSSTSKLISPLTRFLNPNSFNQAVGVIVDKELEGTTGTYSVVIKDLKTGDTYYKNEKREYISASLYKLWVMGTAYEQIEKGTLAEDEQVSKSAQILNQTMGVASESAEIKSGVVSYTVGSALNQMITISHNYAALLLSERVNLVNVRKWLEAHGMNNSNVRNIPPTTTPEDIALFFEKLYKGELGSKESTDKMLSLLKKQQLRNKLPLKLPKDIELAHKTGELDMVTHDAGIVYTPNGDYVIVVMSESENPKGAEDRIANISKAVYEYYTQ